MSFKVNDRVEVRSGAGADFNLGVDVDIVRGQIVARHEPRIEAGTYGLFFRADDVMLTATCTRCTLTR